MIIEYVPLLIYIVICGLGGLILFYLSWFFNNKVLGRRRFTIYECGFRSLGGNMKPFTAGYYIICLLFLLFDIEFLYLYPFLFTLKSNILQKSFICIWIFSILLIVSYLYEILKGSLKWYDGSQYSNLKKKIKQLRFINRICYYSKKEKMAVLLLWCIIIICCLIIIFYPKLAIKFALQDTTFSRTLVLLIFCYFLICVITF